MGILLVLLIAAFLLIVMYKIDTRVGKILLMAGIAVIVVFAAFMGLLMLVFSPNAEFYSVIILIAAVWSLIFAGSAIRGSLKKKTVYIPLSIAAAACVIAVIGFSSYNRYVENIPTVEEDDRLLASYAPYSEGTKVVSLGETSALTISEDIPVMDGATALYPIYSAFAKAVYPKELIEDIANSGAKKISDETYLKCTTTTRAYENIVTGNADIIFVAPPSEQQKQFAADNGVELVYTPIGREAFVFFVNAKNPIEDISLEQVQKIYSGEITKWDELNIPHLGKIRAFQREEGSGSQSSLRMIMAGKKLITPPQEDVVDGMGGIIRKTADYKNFKNAIGYSFRFYSTEMVKNNQIKLLSIDGVYPDTDNIENGTYPIASEFYAVTRSDADENTMKLLEWILSEQGQKIIEMTGYTPLKNKH